MALYRSKTPVVVEATQWLDPGDHPAVRMAGGADGKDHRRAVVTGQMGEIEVRPGDWIIRDPDGSGHYPCAPDVFVANYEAM